MGEPRPGRLKLRSRGGYVPLSALRRPWPHSPDPTPRDPREVFGFGLGVPYVVIQDDGAGGLLLSGGGPARLLLREVTVPKDQIVRACCAKSKARLYSVRSLALQTRSGQTFVLELSQPDIEFALRHLSEAGVPIESQLWVWGLRF